MDALAPPLKALLHIKLKIRAGKSVRESIKEYVQESMDCPFAKNLGLWLFYKESEQPQHIEITQTYRKLLVEVLNRGLEGDQILKPLESLEEEMVTASMNDLDKQLQKLPFIVLTPLLLLQLPAFLILIFAPLVFQLLSEMGY